LRDDRRGAPWVMALDAQTADPETRARFGAGLDAAQVARFGWLLLRTCQRVELLGGGERPTAAALIALAGVEAAAHARAHTGDDAARRVLRLAAGLESVVVGEDQVLDQVRGLRRSADHTPLVGGRLVGLLDLAIHVGRRARAERPRSEHTFADRAMAWLQVRLGSLQGAHLLVVGSGPMGKESARLGTLTGARVSLASRTPAMSGSDRLTLADAALRLPFADGAIVALAAPWSDARAARLRDASAAVPCVVDLSAPPAIPDPLRTHLGHRLTSLEELIGAGAAADPVTDAYVAHADALVDAAVARLRRRVHEDDR
jgi:glutamyl-tRNA reductase